MDIPVYLIAGFLDAGKTEFINGILRDGFAAEDRTLLLCCEEGENGYDPKVLGNVFTYTVEDEDQLTPDFLKKLEKQYRPKQVIVEYNGMWSMEKLYREGLPANWILYQIMCLVDATTFEMYLKNMGQLMMEKITNCDMLIFNRCNEQLRAQLRSRNMMDNPGRYEGVEVSFKALMCHSKKFKGVHCPGRFAMVCCDKDMQFLALVCRGEGLEQYKDKQWVKIHATVKKEACDAYQGEGPVLYVTSIAATTKPDPEMVSF